MTKTGIVRKIDDLGRIVIPKEIRNTLNVRNNDELEIFIEEDKIILKKYCRLMNFKDYAEYYAKLFERLSDKYIFICDMEKVIVSPNTFKDIENKNISNNIYKLIIDRQKISGNDLRITTSDVINKNYIFYPIVINVDAIGAIILFSDKEINDVDKYTINIIKALLQEKINVD